MVVDFDQLAFGEREGARAGVEFECGVPCGGIVGEEAAKEAAEVGGDGVSPSGVGVDDARECVAGEEKMVVPEVAEAGEEGDSQCGGVAQFQVDAGNQAWSEVEDAGEGLSERRWEPVRECAVR